MSRNLCYRLEYRASAADACRFIVMLLLAFFSVLVLIILQIYSRCVFHGGLRIDGSTVCVGLNCVRLLMITR